MLTCAAESKLGHYIQQINGPALGIMQMEPTTDQDIWLNFLNYSNMALRQKMVALEGPLGRLGNLLNPAKYNLAYQIAMARIYYWRKPESLPDSIVQLAAYWKRHYNTHLGKGTIEGAVERYLKLCLPIKEKKDGSTD